jgi:hypothetical protein
MMRGRATLGCLAAAVLLTGLTGAAAPAEDWGTIKGKVVWGGGKLPKREEVVVTKDKDHCLAQGKKIYKQNWVINEKNKGVRYAVVYLVDAEKYSKPLSIHPKLKEVPKKPVVMDQPRCMFEPRVVAVRQGQPLKVKNSAPITHNSRIDGGDLGPSVNPSIPPGKSFEVPSIPARPTVIPISCSIHPWMNGWVFSFRHPYFAVTDADGNFEIKDAPAGKYKLIIWHEEGGWVIDGTSPMRKGGKVIDIVKGKTTDLGKFEAKPITD